MYTQHSIPWLKYVYIVPPSYYHPLISGFVPSQLRYFLAFTKWGSYIHYVSYVFFSIYILSSFAHNQYLLIESIDSNPFEASNLSFTSISQNQSILPQTNQNAVTMMSTRILGFTLFSFITAVLAQTQVISVDGTCSGTHQFTCTGSTFGTCCSGYGYW